MSHILKKYLSDNKCGMRIKELTIFGKQKTIFFFMKNVLFTNLHSRQSANRIFKCLPVNTF